MTVQRGAEERLGEQLRAWLNGLTQFSGIRVLLTLSFDELPNLCALLTPLLAVQPPLLALVVLAPHRRPQRYLKWLGFA